MFSRSSKGSSSQNPGSSKTPSAPKKRIAVALYRRDPYSADPNKRRIFKYDSFHWEILVIPKKGNGQDCEAYGATDRNNLISTKTEFYYENPKGNWWFKSRSDINPWASGKLLGYAIIGSVEKSRSDIEKFLEKVPLPKKGGNPQESCVTWVENAIARFQRHGWVDKFRVDAFMEWAYTYAIQMVDYPQSSVSIVDYRDLLKQWEQEDQEEATGKGKGKGKKK